MTLQTCSKCGGVVTNKRKHRCTPLYRCWVEDQPDTAMSVRAWSSKRAAEEFAAAYDMERMGADPDAACSQGLPVITMADDAKMRTLLNAMDRFVVGAELQPVYKAEQDHTYLLPNARGG